MPYPQKKRHSYPSPVTIERPGQAPQTVTADAFKGRVPPSNGDKPGETSPDGDPPGFVPITDDDATQEVMETEIRKTLIQVMRNSVKWPERTAAATAAVKYLAIKYKVGPEFGGGLDDDPKE